MDHKGKRDGLPEAGALPAAVYLHRHSLQAGEYPGCEGDQAGHQREGVQPGHRRQGDELQVPVSGAYSEGPGREFRSGHGRGQRARHEEQELILVCAAEAVDLRGDQRVPGGPERGFRYTGGLVRGGVPADLPLQFPGGGRYRIFRQGQCGKIRAGGILQRYLKWNRRQGVRLSERRPEPGAHREIRGGRL